MQYWRCDLSRLHRSYFFSAIFSILILAIITGAIVVASNPVGWAIGLIIGGAILVTSAIAFAKKAYNQRKKQITLDKLHADNEREFSLIQNHILEEKGQYSSTSLHLLQKFGIKLTGMSAEGDILCKPGKQLELKLGPHSPPLFFNNKTGELYFKKALRTGFEKIGVRENQDMNQLAKQLK